MSTPIMPRTQALRGDTCDAVQFEREMRSRYCAIRRRIPTDGVRTTVLHIGAQATGIVTGNDGEPQTTLVLAIGSERTARTHFRHVPPTAPELEDAIATVEDQLVQARALAARRSTLFTTDAAIRQIALTAGVPATETMVLSLDAVEQTFEHLVAVTLGRSPVSQGIPESAGFAATLLILREFMHHLQFMSINVAARCN